MAELKTSIDGAVATIVFSNPAKMNAMSYDMWHAVPKVFADPQVKHMQVRAEVTHPRLGKIGLINQPIKLSRTPAKLATATPERGQHTSEVLQDAGYSKNDVDDFKSKGIV